MQAFPLRPSKRHVSVRRVAAISVVVGLLAGSVADASSDRPGPPPGSPGSGQGAGRADEARGIRRAQLEVVLPETEIGPRPAADGQPTAVTAALEVDRRGSRLRTLTVSDLGMRLDRIEGAELWEPTGSVVAALTDVHLDLVGAPAAAAIRGRVTGDLGGGVGWRARATGVSECDGGNCSLDVTVSGRITDGNGEGNCGELTVHLAGRLDLSSQPLLSLGSPTPGSLSLRAGCELTPVAPTDDDQELEPEVDDGAAPEPGPDIEFGPLDWSPSLTVRGDGANGYATRGFGGGNPVTALDGKGVVMCYTAPGPEVRVSWLADEDALRVHDAARANEVRLTSVTAVGRLPLDACSLARLADGSLLLLVLDVGARPDVNDPDDEGVAPSVRVFKDSDGLGTNFDEVAVAYTDAVNTSSIVFADAVIGVPLVEARGGIERIMVPGLLPQTTRQFAPATVPVVLVSTDGGITWQQHLLTDNRYVEGFRGLARFDNGLFAVLTVNWGGISTQLWRSTDDGVTWQRAVDLERRSTLDGRGASLFSGHGHDAFNYLVFHNNAGRNEIGPGEESDRTTLFRIYRAPASSAIPLDATAFGRGTAADPGGLDGDAFWEFVGGPFGDDGYEVLTVLGTGTVVLWGTTIFGGGSKVHAYLGDRSGQ